MSDTDQGATTAQMERFRQKLHEQLGAWLAGHWTQLASAAGGLLAGVFAMYALFASSVHGAHQAADEAKSVAQDLKPIVAALQATVGQLVTQQQLADANLRIKQLEDWKCYAQQYRSRRPPEDCDQHDKP